MVEPNARAGRRLVATVRRAARRVAAAWWPMLHCAAAAALAWAVARHLIHHHRPVFAPIAAVAALNTAVGERGLNAVRLLAGVVIGIVVGELGLLWLGDGYATVAAATFTAMAVALAMGGARTVVAESAGSAILTIALANGEAGTQRLEDAAIGGTVALVFSQLLFTPEPVALVRRAEVAVLSELAAGLRLTAHMLDSGHEAAGRHALERLREVRDPLCELGRTRRVSPHVVRRSAAWRHRMAPLVRENENAGHLDLLAASCLLLARTAQAVAPQCRPALAAPVRALAEALGLLADRPGDRATRQQAVDRAFGAYRAAGAVPPPARVVLRYAATDIMIFAGADPHRRAGDSG